MLPENALFKEEILNIVKSREVCLPMKCLQCSIIFTISKYRLRHILNPNHRSSGKFCSAKCANKNKETFILTKCDNCSIIFKKTKNQYLRTSNHFCSNSCAATINNSLNKSPKHRLWDMSCLDCGIKIFASDSFCEDCWRTKPKKMKITSETRLNTLQNRSRRLTVHARKIMKDSIEECNFCKTENYKDLQVCHIKDKKYFDPMKHTVGDVNNKENLIVLCKSCHKEFDKLPLADKYKKAGDSCRT